MTEDPIDWVLIFEIQFGKWVANPLSAPNSGRADLICSYEVNQVSKTKEWMCGLNEANSSRVRLWEENAAFAARIPPGAMVLDAGAGSGPYMELFGHARYESADFEQVNKDYAPATYTCDLANIPVESSRYDYVIFNQVLEHLPEPKRVLQELHRVLKPSGQLIFSAPLFYEEHEQPYDFYRYTQFGLKHLFQESGFEIERLDWLEGYFGTVGYQLNCMSRYLPSKPRELGGGWKGAALAPCLGLVKLSASVGSMAFHKLETRFKYQDRGYPKNYLAILKKPKTAAFAPAPGVV